MVRPDQALENVALDAELLRFGTRLLAAPRVAEEHPLVPIPI